MPELPEVELIARSLNMLVSGRTILNAELLRQRLAPDTPQPDFPRLLSGSRLDRVGRRGKHILFALDNGMTLIVHLRMSGRFSLRAEETEDPKFTHAVFHLDDGDRLVFDDQRHFGLMKIVESARLHDAKELKKLAPEPFSDEFSVEYLRAATKHSKRSLKEFLIDQTKVCGLGNIYACEAMFAAGVSPRRPANKLTMPGVERLHASIRAVLNEAITHASAQPVDPKDLKGNYFSAGSTAGWYVYGRENEPCRHCNTPIVRLKQGGRSTYFCRKCQRK
jgi:formamidopyrimidine-DNA glycosylase